MKGRITLTVGLATGLALLVLAGLSGQTGRALDTCDRYVLGSDGSNSSDCSDEDNPCKSIQYAIDQADPADVICVAYHTSASPRTYTETLAIHESITLEGAWQASCTGPNCTFSPTACDPANVIIDADGFGRVISISGSIAPTIDCFTIRGGDAAGLGGDPGSSVENDAGGGIYSRDAAPIIVNNVISGNFGCISCPVSFGRGGGIYLLNAPATAVISNNLVAWNVADDTTWGQGGGIMLRDSDAQVITNTIEHNRAGLGFGYGGGVMVKDGNPTIADNAIANNVAGQGAQGSGGGIMVWSDEAATIEGNLIEWNKALAVGVGHPVLISHGGGIHFEGAPTATAVIRDNTIRHNTASTTSLTAGCGGGMSLVNLASPSIVSENRLTYNEASFNYEGRGGGVCVYDSEVSIIDNLVMENSGCWAGTHGEGGGLYIYSGTVLIEENRILGNYGARWLGFPSTATGYGGGVAAVEGQTTIQNNSILFNWGTRANYRGRGGGIFANGGNPRILDNDISSNGASAYSGGFGGGVAISNSIALVQDNSISGNIACLDTPYTDGGWWGEGGGVHILNSTVQLLGNTISGNTGADRDHGYGGGAFAEGSTIRMDRNTITVNYASPGANSDGGAVYLTFDSVFTMTNNIIARNRSDYKASGVDVLWRSTGVMAHNTIADNYGGDGAGIRVQSSSQVTLYNNIVVTQTVGITNTDYPTSTVSASYTLFENNGLDYGADVVSSFEIAGPAMLQSDYHLRPGSNAQDQAPPLGWVTRDIDSDPRPVGTHSDVGADEYALRTYLPLVFRDY